MVVGRKLGIDTGRRKEINSDFRLHEKMALETWREFAVTA